MIFDTLEITGYFLELMKIVENSLFKSILFKHDFNTYFILGHFGELWKTVELNFGDNDLFLMEL